MQVVPFIAESASDAVTKIRAELGPEAVVLNVRQLPPDGISKFWKKPRIEVLAYRPETSPVTPPDPLLELREEVRALRQQKVPMDGSAEPAPSAPSSLAPLAELEATRSKPAGRDSRSWRVTEILENSGLLPVFTQRVLDAMKARHGDLPPPTLSEELVLARQGLQSLWPNLPATGPADGGPHVLIGPAGAGKTTCICKWLAQAKLVQGRTAMVWRLDGATANAAESLSVFCEILGVPVERTWSAADRAEEAEVSFIDLPGIDWRNPAALRELGRQIKSFGPGRIHLVLNAAYEVPLLLAQARAFAPLAVDDLILTHLDEEPRWGKVWNLVLGTNVPVRFLSAAQNIPGEFALATVEKILQRQFNA